eukprot:gene37264-45982_t
MKLWQRFALLGMMGVLLVLPPLVLYLDGSNKRIDYSATERSGVAPSEAALRLLQRVQQHRGLSAAFVTTGQLAGQRSAKAEEVGRALAEVETLLKGEHRATAKVLAQVRNDWQALQARVASRSLGTAESYQGHTALCEVLLLLLEGVADRYGLALDPDADSYYLMRGVLFDLPQLSESTGQLRAKGAGILASKQIDIDGRAAMYGLLAFVHAGAAEQFGRQEVHVHFALPADADAIGALFSSTRVKAGPMPRMEMFRPSPSISARRTVTPGTRASASAMLGSGNLPMSSENTVSLRPMLSRFSMADRPSELRKPLTVTTALSAGDLAMAAVLAGVALGVVACEVAGVAACVAACVVAGVVLCAAAGSVCAYAVDIKPARTVITNTSPPEPKRRTAPPSCLVILVSSVVASCALVVCAM